MELDKEIIEDFKLEANAIIQELKIVLEKLEETENEFPKGLLEEFANKIDRIMGTANTFHTQFGGKEIFRLIGNLGGLCKATGYKASTLNHIALIPIFAAFWMDTIEIVENLIQNLSLQSVDKNLDQKNVIILQKRLTWLAEQIVKLTKAQDDKTETAVINVDGLLAKLGIKV